MINIRPASFAEIARAHQNIPEFENMPESHFAERCANNEHLAITAHINGDMAGYALCYDRYNDGSLYIWMVGVDPAFRRAGIYTALHTYIETSAKDRSYRSLRIKTRNNRREMLGWLVKNNYSFMAVDKKEDPADNRIHLFKSL